MQQTIYKQVSANNENEKTAILILLTTFLSCKESPMVISSLKSDISEVHKKDIGIFITQSYND